MKRDGLSSAPRFACIGHPPSDRFGAHLTVFIGRCHGTIHRNKSPLHRFAFVQNNDFEGAQTGKLCTCLRDDSVLNAPSSDVDFATRLNDKVAMNLEHGGAFRT